MSTCTYNPADVVELFGEADARELLRLAESDLRTRFAALRAALESGDRTGAARAAHSMAGVSGNVMAQTLSDLARELEGVLVEGTEPPPAFLTERLGQETDGVLAIMAGYLGGSPAQ